MALNTFQLLFDEFSGQWPCRLPPCGSALLVNADCLDILPKLPSGCVDAVVTDPPYGIGHSSAHGASWMNTKIANDHDTTTRDKAILMLNGFPKAVFGTWKTSPPDGVRACLVWDKGPASGMGDLSVPWKPSWELVYIIGNGWSGRRDEGVLRGHLIVTWESKGRAHPHEKPATLMAAILEKLPTAKTVVDPFCGVAPTGVACARLGRRFIGIEISEKYFEIAKTRIDQELRQGKLFQEATA